MTVPVIPDLEPELDSPIWNNRRISSALWKSPGSLILGLNNDSLPLSKAMQTGVIFLFGVSIFFGLTSLSDYPGFQERDVLKLMLRFGFISVIAGLLLLPMIAFIWAILQRFSAWFTNQELSFRKTLALTFLAFGYFLTAMVISLPVFLIAPFASLLSEILRFLLIAGAFFMTLRLFCATYQALGVTNQYKAILMAVSPVLILAGILILTNVLAYWASMPYFKSTH